MRLLLSIFILLVAGCFQTVCANRLAVIHLSIDFLLVCVVCCALLMREFPLLVVVVFAGIFKDCFSAGVFGHSVAVFVPISLIIVHLRRGLWVGHWTTQAGLAFTATLTAWLIYNIIQWFWGQPFESGFGFLLRVAILNACIAPFIFRLWKTVLT